MRAKLTFPPSCHTFNVYGIYYSRFSSFSCKLLPILELSFRISRWLKILLKHLVLQISENSDFSFSKSLFHMIIGKNPIDPEAKSSKGRP